jgi:hypothetical protein
MMTAERFAQIVEAHGAEPRRWPADERAAAQAFARAHAEAADPVLRAARNLDAAMDAYAVEARAPDLQARILTALPGNDNWRRWRAPLAAGLAAACAAGVLVGANISRTVITDARTDAVISATLGDDNAAMAALDGEKG